MEAILQAHSTQMPAREVLVALAEKFRYITNALIHELDSFYLTYNHQKIVNNVSFWCSSSPERKDKFVVQMKQVKNVSPL